MQLGLRCVSSLTLYTHAQVTELCSSFMKTRHPLWVYAAGHTSRSILQHQILLYTVTTAIGKQQIVQTKWWQRLCHQLVCWRCPGKRPLGAAPDCRTAASLARRLRSLAQVRSARARALGSEMPAGDVLGFQRQEAAPTRPWSAHKGRPPLRDPSQRIQQLRRCRAGAVLAGAACRGAPEMRSESTWNACATSCTAPPSWLLRCAALACSSSGVRACCRSGAITT